MRNEDHDIEDQTYYLRQTMEERSKFLFKNKLCYGCLKTVTKEHNTKTCSSRRLARCALEKCDSPPWPSQKKDSNKQ